MGKDNLRVSRNSMYKIIWWLDNYPDALVFFIVCFFSINGLKQNARSLLTPVSDPAFYALSHGSKHFLLHGSSKNHLFQRFWLAVEEFWPIRKWLKKLPWRAKPRLPCERAWKAGSETGVKSDLAFCLGSLFKKTNSESFFDLLSDGWALAWHWPRIPTSRFPLVELAIHTTNWRSVGKVLRISIKLTITIQKKWF